MSSLIYALIILLNWNHFTGPLISFISRLPDIANEMFNRQDLYIFGFKLNEYK